jgi:hypothetical protein
MSGSPLEIYIIGETGKWMSDLKPFLESDCNSTVTSETKMWGTTRKHNLKHDGARLECIYVSRCHPLPPSPCPGEIAIVVFYGCGEQKVVGIRENYYYYIYSSDINSVLRRANIIWNNRAQINRWRHETESLRARTPTIRESEPPQDVYQKFIDDLVNLENSY